MFKNSLKNFTRFYSKNILKLLFKNFTRDFSTNHPSFLASEKNIFISDFFRNICKNAITVQQWCNAAFQLVVIKLILQEFQPLPKFDLHFFKYTHEFYHECLWDFSTIFFCQNLCQQFFQKKIKCKKWAFSNIISFLLIHVLYLGNMFYRLIVLFFLFFFLGKFHVSFLVYYFQVFGISFASLLFFSGLLVNFESIFEIKNQQNAR